jgi:exonuclease SbcC
VKINQIHLENIRSYEEQTVEFPEGTILIHGENGAGKTSLLMGLFGGLFLSNITNVGNNNFNLADLVRRGADKGHVDLDFEVDGDEYAVGWTMPGEDSGNQSSATLTSPALSEPVSGITNVQREVTALLGMDEDDFSSSAYVKQGEIDRLIEANDRGAMIDSLLGLDQIEEYIERAKLGRRGARRAYERCQERRRGQEENLDSYARDEDGYVGEIQRLDAEIDEAKATVERYQDHIDDKLTPTLNQITDTLERYDTLSTQLSNKETQIDDAESERTEARRSKQESGDQIDQYNAQVADLRAEIDALDDEVEYDLSSAESTADALDAVQEDLLSAQQEKNTRKNDYDTVKEDLVDARTDLGDVANDLDEAQNDESAKTDAIAKAESTVETYEADLHEQLRDLAETLADFEVAANFGGDDPETEDDVDLAVATDALAPLARERIPERRETLSDEINELTGEIGRLETKAERLSKEANELRELGEAGECPKCGQNVNESHVEDEIAEAESERENVEATITEQEDKKQRLQRWSGQLSGIRNTINDLIDFRDDTLAEAREKVEDLREDRADIRKEINDLEDEKANLEATIDDLETTVSDREEAFENAQEAMEGIAATRETVKDADEKYDAIDERKTNIEQEQQNITHADETIEQLDGHLETLRDEREEIEDELGDLDADELRERKTDFENEIKKWEDKRDEAQSHVEDLRDEYARVDTTLDSLRDLKENIDELERRERWADSVREDLEQILLIYNEVQSDLRETYLGYLNEYANDIFKEIYKNSSYQQVIITEEHDETYNTYDYDIQLLRDDGTTEDPANASGGERAVVNLALRAGIYRLIAHIRGADRSTLPPFILDEPTTFLDEGHVGQLEEMLETIKEWDVSQVFVVSHDESLIHGADHECLVTKDGESTSSVEMRLAGTDYEGKPSGGETETEVALSDGSGAAPVSETESNGEGGE